VTEKEDEDQPVDNSAGLIIFIAIGGTVIVGAVVGFAIWKLYHTFKQNRVKTRPEQMQPKSSKKNKKAQRNHPDKKGKGHGEGM